MQKVPASSLSPECLAALVKLQRLWAIQKSNRPDSDEWQAASKVLDGLWPKLDELNAPLPEHVDWAA